MAGIISFITTFLIGFAAISLVLMLHEIGHFIAARALHVEVEEFVFGFYYIVYLLCKWTVAFCILILFDWWIAIIKAITGKGYVWKSLSLFSSRRKLYYCHSCGHNFRA